MGRQPSCAARGKILTAALQVFGAKGYKEATVREIARSAGVSIGALYPYFGNKEQLYLEVLQEEAAQFNDDIMDLEHEEPESALRGYIEKHLDYMAAKKQIMSRHFKDYDLEFVKPLRVRFFADQKRFLEAIIRRGVEKRVFRAGDSGEAALLVLFMLKGALYNDLAGTMDLGRSADALCGAVVGFLKELKATGGSSTRR